MSPAPKIEKNLAFPPWAQTNTNAINERVEFEFCMRPPICMRAESEMRPGELIRLQFGEKTMGLCCRRDACRQHVRTSERLLLCMCALIIISTLISYQAQRLSL